VTGLFLEGGDPFAEERDVLAGRIGGDGKLGRLGRNGGGKRHSAQEQSLHGNIHCQTPPLTLPIVLKIESAFD
jgi:hypothetical protein